MNTASEMHYRVERAPREKEYFEPAVVLLTVLKGSVEIDYGGRKDRIRKGDAVVVNIGVLYSLRSYEDSLVGKCYWSTSLLSDVLKGRHAYFYCNTAAEYSRYNKELSELLDNLTAVYAQGGRQTDSLLLGYLFRILDLLIEHYQITGNGTNGRQHSLRAAETSKKGNRAVEDRSPAGSEEAAYMPAIMEYILQNLHGRVNLTDLAEELFVSTSTLSRVFRKNTGVYFADYVMQLRVKEAAALLRDTEDSLTRVAFQMGFSGSSVFSRTFKKEMGETPGEYRDRIRKQKAENGDLKAKEEKQIRNELLSYGTRTEDGVLRRLVTEDLNNTENGSLKKIWNTAINLGEVYDLTKANIQEHCLYLRDHLHYRYVRLWNVFSRNLMISDGRTAGRFNFSLLDQVLDFLMRNHLKPFLDFGRRPSMAMFADGEDVYYEETYTKFISREVWEQAVREVLTHISRKYGKEEVRTWYLELSRDSMHGKEGERCYEEESFDFFEAWQYVWKTAKTIIPGVMFGGISSILESRSSYLEMFYQRCAEKHCVPDFCSFAYFPYTRKEIFGDKDLCADVTNMEEGRNVGELLGNVRRLMRENGAEDARLFLTDLNNTIVNRDYLNDSCFRAAYLIRDLLRMQQYADMVCVMTVTDWISYYMDTTAIVHGGIGLLTKDSIRKPACFALEFLERLGNTVLAQGEDYILTRSASGSYYLLCCYFQPLRYANYPVENGYGPDLSRLQPEDAPVRALHFKLSGLPDPGYYCIKKRTLSASSGSVLNEWEKFQFAEDLTADDIHYLRERCIPEINMSRKYVTQAQELSFVVEMKPEDVVLLHIYKG